MTLLDMIHDSYIKIFEAIKTYQYSVEQYTDIIHSMVYLQRVIFSLNNLNPNEKISEENIIEIEEFCKNDFCRAFRGEDYCDNCH